MENLKRINDLCCEFRDAAELQIEIAEMAGSDVRARIGEIREVGQGYAFQRYTNIKPVLAVNGGEPVLSEEQELRRNIKKIDAFAAAVLRAVEEKEVALCVPDELRNANDISALRFIGAQKLARLCAVD